MVTDPLLEELSSLEDVLRLDLRRAWMEAIAIILGLGDVLSLAITCALSRSVLWIGSMILDLSTIRVGDARMP
jgi:hypothetical protein